jgi:hypothetical protein
VEAPALSRREQRAFRRAAARLELRRCPSCDAAVQKTGGCNNMSCLCGASFQWSRATPLVACRTYHYDSNERRYCCPHCLPAAYAKLGAVRVARAAAIVPAATVAATVAGAVVVAGGSVAAAVAVVPAAVFGPLARADPADDLAQEAPQWPQDGGGLRRDGCEVSDVRQR